MGGKSPTARLRQGTYVGKTVSGPDLPRAVEAFLGVPYAAKCGRLRRAELPAPAASPSETFDASKYGPACPTVDPSVPASEDCLSANIFRPAGTAEEKQQRPQQEKEREETREEKKKKLLLPVMVYVHGGAFNFGRGADRNLAAFVAFAKRDVVAVSFNYRLGPLGFLPGGIGLREGVSNLGLLDQRLLLEWVQDNIAAFGGDAADVTAVGFSAGAHSLGHHILCPASRRLFAKAILESGAATARSVLATTHPRHETQFARFLSRAYIPRNLPPDQILPAVRALPLPELLHASLAVWSEYAPSLHWPFQPSIDSDGGSSDTTAANTGSPNTATVIPTLPIRSWHSPFLPTPPPLITGFNTSEGTIFVPASASSPTALKDFFAALVPSLSVRDLDALDALYPPATAYPPPPPRHGAQFRRLADAYGHYGYVAPLLHSAHLASRRGAPVWVYEYAARADLAAANHGDHVAAATRDVNVLSASATPGLWAASEAMHGFWSSFITSSSGDDDDKGVVGKGIRVGKADKQERGNDAGPNALPNSSGLVWPRFISPFGDTPGGADDYVPKEDDETEVRGKIIVFGDGNDERMGSSGQGRPGTVARVRSLTKAEMQQFRFWWDRVELSEGMAGVDEDASRL